MDAADDVTGSPASSAPGYKPATLQQRLQDGSLSPERCLRYSQDLLSGLASLHHAGMVHRDVKPSNCLFLDGTLKLADFGLVAEADPQISRVGTELYMPPDGRMDTRADVYAAGLVIYEMITGLPVGRFPHLGEKAAEVIDHPVLSALNRVALRACEHQPADRFPDAAAMLAAVSQPEPVRPIRSRLSRRRVFAGLTAMTLAIFLGGAGLWLRRDPESFPFNVFGTPDEGPVSYVEVNFITRPFNATIHLDGNLQTRLDSTPYLTPCTALITPGVHHTVFKLDGYPDLKVGYIDYSAKREIEVSWPASP
jgi:serine/threonine protein kinase